MPEPYFKNFVTAEEAGCTSDLAAQTTVEQNKGVNPPNNRTAVNNSHPYRQTSWISTGSSNNNVIVVTQGDTTPIALQLNTAEFLCAILVNNSYAGTPYTLDASAEVNGGNYPNDRTPLGVNGNGAAQDASSTIVDSASVTPSTAGSISNIAGAVVNLNRDNNSRYWFANQLNFSLSPSGGSWQPPPGTSTETITINLKERTIYQYYNNNADDYCLASTTIATGSMSNFANCPEYPNSVSFTLEFRQQPPVTPLIAGSPTCTQVSFQAYDPINTSDAVTSTSVTNNRDGGAATEISQNGNTYTYDISPWQDASAETFTISATDGAGTSTSSFNIGPCASPTCIAPAGPTADVSSGVPFTVTGVISWSPYGSRGSPVPPSMPSVTMTSSPPSSITPTGSQGGSYGGGTQTETQSFSATVSATGTYTFTEGVSGYSPGGQCSTSFVVVNQPYFKVYGGSVMAGSGFASNGYPCQPTSGAQALAWDTSSYSGASTDQGSFVVALVNGFASMNGASASGSGIGAPESLTFANGGGFGGNYGSSNCAGVGPQGSETSYYTALKASQYYEPGAPSTISGYPAANANANRHVYLYSGVNVFITGDVAFPGWTSFKDMPLFYVVDYGGDIYIDSNVAQLAGVYVAEPNGSAGGNIYTCNNTIGGAVVAKPTDPFSQCTNHLTVTGALIAQNVHFLRTPGTVSSAAVPNTTSNCANSPDPNAAETVCFPPLLWLANPLPANGQLRAVTGLPPTL